MGFDQFGNWIQDAWGNIQQGLGTVNMAGLNSSWGQYMDNRRAAMLNPQEQAAANYNRQSNFLGAPPVSYYQNYQTHDPQAQMRGDYGTWNPQAALQPPGAAPTPSYFGGGFAGGQPDQNLAGMNPIKVAQNFGRSMAGTAPVQAAWNFGENLGQNLAGTSPVQAAQNLGQWAAGTPPVQAAWNLGENVGQTLRGAPPQQAAFQPPGGMERAMQQTTPAGSGPYPGALSSPPGQTHDVAGLQSGAYGTYDGRTRTPYPPGVQSLMDRLAAGEQPVAAGGPAGLTQSPDAQRQGPTGPLGAGEVTDQMRQSAADLNQPPGIAAPGAGGGGAPQGDSNIPAGVDAAWWEAFKKEHNGENPIDFYSRTGHGMAEALRDRDWGDAIFRDVGRAPNEAEWRQHFFETGKGDYAAQMKQRGLTPGQVNTQSNS